MTVDGPAPMRTVASFQSTTSIPTSTPATAPAGKSGPGRSAPARQARIASGIVP